MIRNVKRQYFEAWGTEEAQNVILKWFSLFLIGIILIETGVIAYVATRDPKVIAIGEQKSQVLIVKKPRKEILEDELDRTVRNYAITHYSWDYSTIEAAHKEASKHIAEKFKKSFFKTNDEQVRYVKEKKVSQRVYVSDSIKIDPKNLNARVRLDRIYSIDGLVGSSPFALDIKFEYGPRTEDNPEGVYIFDEKLVTEEGGR